MQGRFRWLQIRMFCVLLHFDVFYASNDRNIEALVFELPRHILENRNLVLSQESLVVCIQLSIRRIKKKIIERRQQISIHNIY